MVAFSIAGATGSVKDWLPTHLFTALGDLPKGVAFDGYFHATAVAVVLTNGRGSSGNPQADGTPRDLGSQVRRSA